MGYAFNYILTVSEISVDRVLGPCSSFVRAPRLVALSESHCDASPSVHCSSLTSTLCLTKTKL